MTYDDTVTLIIRKVDSEEGTYHYLAVVETEDGAVELGSGYEDDIKDAGRVLTGLIERTLT